MGQAASTSNTKTKQLFKEKNCSKIYFKERLDFFYRYREYRNSNIFTILPV